MADSFILIAKYYVTSRHQDLHLGAVHKVRHAMFGQFCPLLPVTLCHTSQDPPKVHHTSRTPIFSRPSTKKPNKKTHVQILCQLFVGVFVREVLSEVFCLEGFVQDGFCPFPLLSEYIHYNRKLNITLNFRFYMYDKKFISVTSHPLDPLPLSQTVTPSRTPFPLDRKST